MRAERKVMFEEWVADAAGECVDELKERLWREVWKKEIELEGVKVEVREVEGGFIVTASVGSEG